MRENDLHEEVEVLAHSCIRIQGDATVYFDPFELTQAPHDADVVCITHSHYDHFSPDDLRRVLKSDTTLVMPESMREEKEVATFLRQNRLADVRAVAPGQRIDVPGGTLEAVRAYNVGKDFHLREYDWVGYLLTMGGTRYYVAGDTDAHPENLFVGCDVALVPVGGTYTFTAEEAAEFVGKIQTRVAIPTHYGSAVGRREDGARFVEACKRVCPQVTAFERLRFED